MAIDSRVVLDSHTLRDLDLFSDGEGGSGLFDSINTTRTQLGSEALKARLKKPFVNPAAIDAMQEALAFLRESTVDFPIESELLTAVDRYLRSRIEVARWNGVGSKLRTMSAVVQHQEVLPELSRGAAASSNFLFQFCKYCEIVLSQKPGPFLEKLLMSALTDSQSMVAAGLSESCSAVFWNVFHRDALFRLQYADKLRRLVEVAADLDALVSMAHFGVKLGFVAPEIVTEVHVFEAVDLVHPMVENAVGNSVKVGASANVIYLTGPNMAGKTTFLKAIGVCQFLAQCGMLVPAKHVRFSPVEVLLTGINTTDNLSSGVSYYLAEVQRMKLAAETLAAGKCSLMLFDEVFKGTNVLDATEATRLVIESCVELRNSMFVFSSHLSGIAEVLAQKGVLQRSFSGEIRGGKPCFSYQLQSTSSGQRMGLHLLKHEGVLDLLREAKNLAARDDTT